MNYCNGSWVEVDLRRLRRNVESIQRGLGRTTMIAVVKSDAYGHGLAGMARGLRAAGVRNFAVAYPAEAEIVRREVPDADRIVVLGVATPADVPLLLRDRIETTLPKAKQARRDAEKMVPLARKGTLAARRLAAARLRSPAAVKRLFDAVVPVMDGRPGGYTRIIKTDTRRGDAAEMAILEWVAKPQAPVEPEPVAEQAPKA